MASNVFILSMGRSGTTLLQNMLDAHPNIVSPPESFFMLHLYTRYKNEREWSQRTIKQFITDLYTDRPFRLIWNVPRSDVEAAFEKAGKIHSYAEACNAVRMSFEKAYENEHLELFGDKKPSYWMFVDRILKIHKDAKIVHMIRDPRGVGNGQINTFKRWDVLAVGAQWSKLNHTLRSVKELIPEQYYLLKYEDLVADPDNTMRSLFEFLGIEFSDDVLNYRAGVVSRFDTHSKTFRAKHESLLKPIDPSIAERWKTMLKPKHRRHIEYTTQRLAAEFGYVFERPKPTVGMRIKTGLAKFKIWVMKGVIRLFFSLPIFIRKIVLNIRSRNTDHLYESKS